MASLVLPLLLLSTFPSQAPAATYNVRDFGASPGGETDCAKPFQGTWNAACMAGEPSTVHIPEGKYLISSAIFTGPCKSPSVEFHVDGTLVAPRGNAASHSWLEFNHVSGVSIVGGVLDGGGAALWRCKTSGSSCPLGASSLSIGNSAGVTVTDLTSMDPKLFHVFIYGSESVWVRGGQLLAPKSSPNTDGIHVQMSTKVNISGTTIHTGDDCISVGPGTAGLRIENVTCGPGHGISIGSLGSRREEEGVEKVRVRNVTFKGTQNGLRIKTWARPSNGYVRDVVFERAFMEDVSNPIAIDQSYCPGIRGCPKLQHSGIEISKVTYKDVKGTSATEVAVNLNCSATHPCKGIRLYDINLTYGNRPALASCKHAMGTASRVVTPPSCLQD